MKDFLPFIVVGLASGSIYGLAGMGLALTFKTTGLFNFAHGAIAAAGAYVFYALHVQRGVAWPIAAVITVGFAGPVFGLLVEQLARRLVNQTPSTQVLGTVGLLLLIQSIGTATYGTATRQFPPFLPTSSFALPGVRVGWDQLIVVMVAGVTATGLFLLFRGTRLGLAMRGVVDDASLLELAATDTTRVRKTAWIIGCCVAAMSGVLIAPQLGLDPFLLTLLVVQAFGAAAIGRFSSLPLTYVGGLAIGVGAALSTKYVSTVPSLAGLPPSLPFIVLFVALVFWPPRVAVGSQLRLRGDDAPKRHLPASLRTAFGAAIVIAALLVPFVADTRLTVFTKGMAMVIMFMSLGLLVWTSGQVSLCHAAFMAVGGATLSHLTQGAGLPWAVAVLLAGLATVPLGAMVAIPAIRLSGIYLALATMGFGLLLERLVYKMGFMFGPTGARTAPRPALGTGVFSDRAYYYLVIAVVGLVAVAVVVILRTRLGRVLRALGDSPLALATNGTSTTVTLVLIFCTSAFLAGIAGALLSSSAGSISGVGFGAFDSLTWLVVLVISGRSVLRSAIVAGLAIAVAPSYLPHLIVHHQTMVFGASALLVAITAGRQRRRAGRPWEHLLELSEARLRHSPVRARTAAAQ